MIDLIFLFFDSYNPITMQRDFEKIRHLAKQIELGISFEEIFRKSII